MSSTGHVTTETVFGQTLALRLGDRDEHCALELDMTGLNVKGNLYLRRSQPAVRENTEFASRMLSIGVGGLPLSLVFKFGSLSSNLVLCEIICVSLQR